MNANAVESSFTRGPPLRIAIWVDQQNLLSELTLLRQLSVALSAEGVPVFIISENASVEALAPYVAGFLQVLSGSWMKWVQSGRLGNERHIASEIRRNKIDVLLLMGWSEAQLSVLPLVPDLAIVRWLLDRVDLNQATEDSYPIFASEEVRSSSGAPDHAAVVQPGMLINEGVQPPRRHAGEGILTLACLEAIENPGEYELFLKAFAAARRSADHILLLLDAGIAKDEVWRMARNMKLLNRISFIPPIGAVSSAIQSVDAVINISPQSRLWLVGIEAMAAGRAVICRGASLTNLFTGDTCRIVRHSEDWAQCLEDLAMQPTRTRILCENAHQRVKRQHSMSDFLDRLTGLLNDLRRGSIPLKKA